MIYFIVINRETVHCSQLFTVLNCSSLTINDQKSETHLMLPSSKREKKRKTFKIFDTFSLKTS